MSETENAKRLFFEALALIDSSNFRDAELRLRNALQFAPDNVAILTNLSVVLAQQNQRTKAREYAERTLAINPDNIEALLILADCCTHAGDFNEALAAYDKIIRLDATIGHAHNNRGVILQNFGRYAEALDSYERAIALDANFGDAQINRGHALRLLKRHGDALAAYEKALALNSELPHAWLGRGNVLYGLKRSDEAFDAYEKALALKPDFAEAWLGRGNVLSELKRYDEALDAYGKALALTPELADAWLGRGNVLCELNRYEEALDAHGRALARKPDFAEAWYGRGNVFHGLKRYEDALAAYDKAVALSPDFANAWNGRGDALRLLRRGPDAIAAYRQALKFGGDVESIRYYLAALGAEPQPAAPPERFVAKLFDAYANNFEHDLVVNLKYGIPALVADVIKRYASSNTLDILDLGCGTGLVGEHVRPFRRTLTGVDLSANMLEKARQRQIYDHLLCSDLVEFLQTQDKAFDLAVAADVFIYLGDLSQVFQGVRRALRASGLFCFSVEAADDGGFVLRNTLRYAHSIGYLRTLAEQHQFIVETIDPQVVRRDAGANINGYLAVLRCS
jgi:predicted TPR repeat methyltransferase